MKARNHRTCRANYCLEEAPVFIAFRLPGETHFQAGIDLCHACGSLFTQALEEKQHWHLQGEVGGEFILIEFAGGLRVSVEARRVEWKV